MTTRAALTCPVCNPRAGPIKTRRACRKTCFVLYRTGCGGHDTPRMGRGVGIYPDDDLVVICDDRHSDGCPFRWATSLSASARKEHFEAGL